ncbi:MAG: DNA recombination protein RmuC [Treponema sp.]|nr:DNA recombination protein RmuC [Treponema sp.]
MEFLFPSIIIGLITIVIVLLIILLLKVKQNESSIINSKLLEYEKKLDNYDKNLKDEFERNRKENSESNRESRKESNETIVKFQDSINSKFDTLTKNTQEAMTSNLTKFMSTLSERLDSLSKVTQENLTKQQETVQNSLKNIQDSNEKKLEQMRATVDEKLQSTLEKRLTSSFELVTKQLEAVQKGLGEMQNLASDVGGLKRALSNVKTAGGMGEVQLETILSDFLSVEQFEKNAHPNPSNPRKVVEFAVKIPSKNTEKEYIYLPIDSKYPATVWDNLTMAYEQGDKDQIDALRKQLETEIKKFAKDIKEKYIEVPYTTDFGILFVPYESLYAELNRIPGLVQKLQNELKVTIAGPSTLTALLNSLQMGFRTLAIQKETSKVWDLLGAVKTEFGKFGTVLQKTKEKLQSATSEIEKAETRSRQIERKLTKIDALPDADASKKMLEIEADDSE